MSDLILKGTTGRHNDLVSELYRRIANKLDNLITSKQVVIRLEQIALGYYGTAKEILSTELINYNENIDLDTIEVVYPDIMLFKDNPYTTNKNNTRYIGKPDLIVEVWSNSNSYEHRQFKKHLYSTSKITEHWYINQDSNIVECYFGNNQLRNQCLNNTLKTHKSLEIDISYLAL